MVKDIPKIWSTIAPLAKEEVRGTLEILCQYKAFEICYKAPWISHVVSGLVLNLAFHKEDPDGVRFTVKIFLFPDLSLSEIP